MSIQAILLRNGKLIIAATLCALLAAGIWISQERNRAESRVGVLVSSEDLILGLTPRLATLADSVLNLRLPDHQSRSLFGEVVAVGDLVTKLEWDASVPKGLYRRTWPIEDKPIEFAFGELDLWQPLFETTAYFEHAKFSIIRGKFGDEGHQRFDTDVAFSGAARAPNGTLIGVEATLKVSWRREASSSTEDADAWRIVEWQTASFATRSAGQSLFADVLDQAIPDRIERQRARESRHERIIVDVFTGKEPLLPHRKYNDFFGVESAGQHPGLAVVDIDSDGWDDLYVMARWGKNQLWHNQGDGTFAEVAADYGLDVDSLCTCAAFADFDNDGDPDLFLGRSLECGMYLVNDKGKFVDRGDTHLRVHLPAMTSSIAVADYNSDGLLDVYISVYGSLAERAHELIREFLNEAEFREFEERLKESHRFLKKVGPPNFLLVNRGDGKFDLAPESEQVAVWLTTMQATWSDYDEDGDADLYVANDFGPDKLLRNDGRAGFHDATDTAGHPSMRGFGMGVSFGDYDLDGQQDIYVSNMYSKAGLRITDQLPELDPGFVLSTDGNRLYRRDGNSYAHVSGRQPPALTVAKAGWSWGGQFIDVDNNGYPDLYVPNGYFTAPQEVAVVKDV